MRLGMRKKAVSGEMTQTLLADFYVLNYIISNGFPTRWDESMRDDILSMFESRKNTLVEHLKLSLSYAIAHQFFVTFLWVVEGFGGYLEEHAEDFEEYVTLISDFLIAKDQFPELYDKFLDEYDSSVTEEIVEIGLELAPYFPDIESRNDWWSIKADTTIYNNMDYGLYNIVRGNINIISTAILEDIQWWKHNLNVFEKLINADGSTMNVIQIDSLVSMVHSASNELFPHLQKVLDLKFKAKDITPLLNFVGLGVKKYAFNYEKDVKLYGISSFLRDKFKRLRLAMNSDKYDDVQLGRGIEVEYEHLQDDALEEAMGNGVRDDISAELVKDHLDELPDYYTRLKKMEEEGERALGGRNGLGMYRIAQPNDFYNETYPSPMNQSINQPVTQNTTNVSDFQPQGYNTPVNTQQVNTQQINEPRGNDFRDYIGRVSKYMRVFLPYLLQNFSAMGKGDLVNMVKMLSKNVNTTISQMEQGVSSLNRDVVISSLSELSQSMSFIYTLAQRQQVADNTQPMQYLIQLSQSLTNAVNMLSEQTTTFREIQDIQAPSQALRMT